jgi:outer membrane receptor protein involved in Fe transport
MNTSTNELESTRDNFLYLDYSALTANDQVSGNATEHAQIAYFGRLSWNYGNKYNLQANFRADSYDAAYLDLQNNWGYFPSISAGWTITNEEFMQSRNRDVLSFVKLRASYGVNGSISNLEPYMYASVLASGASGFQGAISYNYYIDDQLITSIYPSTNLANPQLRWEESAQFDAGIDIRLLKDRLTFAADYYNKNTDGLLVRSTSLLTTGTSYVWQNIGVVNNHGFEFDLGWKDVVNKFKYSFRGNISTVSNNVTEYLGEGVRLQGTAMSYFEEGYPVWYIRGYRIESIDPADGRPVYMDLD